MTPSRRQLRFAALDDVTRDLEQLLARPHRTVGRWSLGQICNHLSTNIDHTLDGFPGRSAPWIVRQTLGRAVRGLMLSTGRIMEGAPLPEKYRPSSTLDPTTEVASLRSAIERFTAAAVECAPHPFMGRMSHAKWERFHCVHCAHHLSFVVESNP